jgi:tetratricopeptide (TPR) repeat protein
VKKQSAGDLQQDYLDAIAMVADSVARKAPAQAKEFLAKFAGELAQQSGVEFAELRVIALLYLCHVQQALGQKVESERTLPEALALFDGIGEPGTKLNIEDRLAEVLIQLAEYRRAIRPCEQAIALSHGMGGLKLAARLWRAGRNYLRGGFKDHAEEPLRKALEVLPATEGPRFRPVFLNDLGSALRLQNPAEAEQCYRDAATLWEQFGAPDQATIAWVNLGVLCGELERLQESLEWYEKARKVRLADPATPRERLGSLANNIANLHRRMKNFVQAEREAADAIALLEGDRMLPEAYGTRGLILRDQGLDEASLEWFRKSREEHTKQPSPNAQQLSEVMENEAAALARLGRREEARALERELAELRGDVPAMQTHEVAPAAPPVKEGEGAVLIELDGIHLPDAVYRECDVATLENRIEEVLETGGQGELDGHETGPENTTVFLYGADAEALFRAVEPVLRDYPLCRGARVTVRQGDQERAVVL